MPLILTEVARLAVMTMDVTLTHDDGAVVNDGIVVTDVARSFGTVHAVRAASLHAKPGEVTALIGPNGSGKTTLMLMLASLLAPDSGAVSIAGHDPLTHTAAVRRAIGWMPDTLGSWATLSVRTTLEVTGRLYQLDAATARERAAELITTVGLEELAEKEVNKVKSILTELQRSIQAELERKDGPQMLLDLGSDEPGKQQRERDLSALRRRMNEIPEEIERESEHIRSRFATPSARLFPVAVTWLIPRKAVLQITGGRA